LPWQHIFFPKFSNEAHFFMKSSIPDMYFNSCFKNNNKKNGLDLKNVHISQKFWEKNILP
jgi:hypothetical protein